MSELEALERQISELNDEIDELNGRVEELESERDDLNDNIEDLDDEIEKLESEKSDLENKLDASIDGDNIREYLQEVERELNGTYHVSNPKALEKVVEDIQELLRR